MALRPYFICCLATVAVWIGIQSETPASVAPVPAVSGARAIGWAYEIPTRARHQLRAPILPRARCVPVVGSSAAVSLARQRSHRRSQIGLRSRVQDDTHYDEEILNYDDFREFSEAPTSWPRDLAELFVPLGPHEAADVFYLTAPRASMWRTLLCRALARLPLNPFSIQALLDMGPNHLFTDWQLRRLLEAAGVQLPVARGLDVGAGEGQLTSVLNTVCNSLTTTETSSGCALRLRKQGYDVLRIDVADISAADAVGSFELVSMLNVLDWSPEPQRFLRGAYNILGPPSSSWLLLAVPLPFEFQGRSPPRLRRARPDEPLNLSMVESTWEEHARHFLEHVLPLCGFAPRAVSRLPYLCAADALDECQEWDDMVVVAQKV